MFFYKKNDWSKQTQVRGFYMAQNKKDNKIKIDGVEYKLDKLSENAKAQLGNINFVDAQLQQLNNELAVSDTARIGYTNALKAELSKLKAGE